MKFLIVGLGSMGKRRARNLLHLKAGEIIGFDPRLDRRQEAQEKYGIQTVDTYEKGLQMNPDAVIISTPPELHIPCAMVAARHGKHFFTEASVVDDGLDELLAICQEKGLIAAPSCTMRFQPSIMKIKELLDAQTIGTVATFTYHSGQYLPDWHPWEDYRKFYVSRRLTGACREIVPFELVWLTWVFGPIKKISGMKAKRTALEADIDDVYQLLMEFETGVLGHLLVDVVSRVAYRTCRVLGEEGIISMEWVGSERNLRLYQASNNLWREMPEDTSAREQGYIHTEEPYVREMKAFMDAVTGKAPYPYDFRQDKQILRALYAAEESPSQDPAAILAVGR